MRQKKADRPDYYVLVTQDNTHGYFRLHGRIVTQRLENSEWIPYGGLGDEYDGPLYANLQARCQGDDNSRKREAGREQVYGFDFEYHDVYSVDLRKAERMAKTLKAVSVKLDKINETRGYVQSFGEYVGRIAEAIGAKGIGVDLDKTRRNGYRWEWMPIGDGVNRVNRMIWQWVEDGKPKPQENTDCELAS